MWDVWSIHAVYVCSLMLWVYVLGAMAMVYLMAYLMWAMSSVLVVYVLWLWSMASSGL